MWLFFLDGGTLLPAEHAGTFHPQDQHDAGFRTKPVKKEELDDDDDDEEEFGETFFFWNRDRSGIVL